MKRTSDMRLRFQSWTQTSKITQLILGWKKTDASSSDVNNDERCETTIYSGHVSHNPRRLTSPQTL